ncbi:hypothetical protein C2845_PM03G28160 [Panicum miliaceum]|uniref:histidine--tRNA ligase n=1 Tax=Panicum miliaceum TaxID=4540 RepID=A0A3L6TE69_PANMI|nr:hypothetical protein C2845_PM03G28160 [Panicum miliaceum]
MAAWSSSPSLRHLLLRPRLPLSPTCLAGSFSRRHVHIHSRRRLFSSASSSTLTHGDEASTHVDADGVVDVNPPRGTRDFPPEDMRLRTWLFDQFREVSRLMAFEEVDFPVLESEALFIRKAGEEITQQLYNFEDKGGRRVVLRPEITPSLARLVIKQGKSVSLPLKWFTIGQCWRYERMTRGRRREHYQWNMDIFGVPKVRAEAELLQAIVLLFQRLGITSSDVGIRVSSRKVLQAVLNMYSIPEHLFTEVCVIVDKVGPACQFSSSTSNIPHSLAFHLAGAACWPPASSSMNERQASRPPFSAAPLAPLPLPPRHRSPSSSRHRARTRPGRCALPWHGRPPAAGALWPPGAAQPILAGRRVPSHYCRSPLPAPLMRPADRQLPRLPASGCLRWVRGHPPVRPSPAQVAGRSSSTAKPSPDHDLVTDCSPRCPCFVVKKMEWWGNRREMTGLEVLGSGVEAVADLKKLFSFAEQYGYADWICFDASVVRGLAYYTGIVFEAFDREGKLRAICGGGRYDRLLSTFGSEDIPACGFGFGDAVIVELLKEKGLLPDMSRQIDDIVFPLDEELEGPASSIASSLRKKGRAVDLVEDKRLKWVFKHAERINASRLILVGNSEWERGMVRVKILSTREEFEVKADDLE